MIYVFFLYYLFVTVLVYMLVFAIEIFIPENTKFKKWWRKNIVGDDYDSKFD